MKRICIDAGHGGQDPGAIGVGGRRESADTLRMALALRDEMKKRGWDCVLTRDKDTYPSIQSRYKFANSAGADVFVSLHRNSAAADGHGLEVLYRTVTVKTSANDKKSKELAQNVNRRCVAAAGFRDRGAKQQNTNTAVLQYTTMPAVTVEAGFVSNNPTNGQESDNHRFDRTFNALISAIADGIEETMGKAIPGSAAPAVKPQTTVLPYTFSSPYCRRGEQGERVRWVQSRLKKHNANPGSVDGIFGVKTETAVKAFQTARRREGRDIGSVDGIVGQKTAVILAEGGA